MLVKTTRKDSLVERGENSPAPEKYTPLKATGVFTKKNPELEFFQETGVPFQQT